MPEAMMLCLAPCLPHQEGCFSKVLVVASCQHRYDLARTIRLMRYMWASYPMTSPAQTHKSFDKNDKLETAEYE